LSKTIAVLGTFDTKGVEFAYLIDRIREAGCEVLSIDAGIIGKPYFEATISREEVAKAGGTSIAELVEKNDRGYAVTAMMQGAGEIALKLYEEGKIDGIISMGGSAGTTIGTYAMRKLPVGVPKVMISTLASGDVAKYVGPKDIFMLNSIVDISGINKISKTIFSLAAGAVTGAVKHAYQGDVEDDSKKVIAASMFGVTTPCVTKAKEYLEAQGYEVLVFHATGSGGRCIESLVDGGMVHGVLDITTTEWCDELVGGVFNAGPERLDAAAKKGIPQVVSCGALDMVNFGEWDSVPQKFKDRNLYKHNATVTLMRTTKEECAELGRIIAEKLNQCVGPCTVMLPLGGVSAIDKPGAPFYGPEDDAALFDAIRKTLNNPNVKLVEMDNNINDDEFALAAAKALDDYLKG
jgi:uncharacterized protein (UPF0261 family)